MENTAENTTIAKDEQENQVKQDELFKFDWKNCKLLKTIFIMAGIFIIFFTLLALFVSTFFIMFVLAIGALQITFGITGLCPLAIILNNLGFKCKIEK